uniref:Secreted protein n=1 Tax=Angiostrongylus cantonensis TaxID=6313 RepID=A0A0K0DDI3_ANGCA
MAKQMSCFLKNFLSPFQTIYMCPTTAAAATAAPTYVFAKCNLIQKVIHSLYGNSLGDIYRIFLYSVFP